MFSAHSAVERGSPPSISGVHVDVRFAEQRVRHIEVTVERRQMKRRHAVVVDRVNTVFAFGVVTAKVRQDLPDDVRMAQRRRFFKDLPRAILRLQIYTVH